MELELTMFVAIGTVTLHLPGIGSLKEKRSIIKSLLERIRARYNVSAAEIGNHDIHGRATLGIAAISAAGDHAQRQIETVFRFIEETRPDLMWIDSDIELV